MRRRVGSLRSVSARVTPADQDAVPKVTPYLLRTADTMCARRLALEHAAEPGTVDPVNRARVRNALLDAVRVWHERGAWVPQPGLVAEERALVDHACRWYARRFPEPVESVDVPADHPTLLARRGVTLGGWVDLGVVHRSGDRELRQLSWHGRGAPSNVLEEPAVRLAVLRLACLGWVDGPLTVTAADLLTGDVARAEIRPEALAEQAGWLDERLAVVRERAADPTPVPGRDCAGCRYIPRCPAHQVRASMVTRRDSLLPAIVALSPSTLDAWQRCARECRNRALLGLPASDGEGATEHGLLLHRLLNLVHRTGSCHDAEHVDGVLSAHGADDRTVEEIRRHVARCPAGADPVGHEVEWARAHAGPPVFLATARLDAVWDHDGLLDVRDYKSGRASEYPIEQDRRAQLQAWVAAPRAAERGLRLRLRYEHLATEVVEDPEPWEPTEDDLARIEEELAATVTEMRAEREFRGVADAGVCARCRYRSICDDSAAPGVPSWPAADAPEAAETAQPESA